ncbi:MAG: methylenetetrahydrofolate reductase [Prevotellaceae bacterium]|jgi:methylenetetrahydrofolate reductase (NADPH)|nr:methylenetetrahydrofolate reductase [Prevotellaceae bacterium]
MKIALELVPKDEQYIRKQVDFVKGTIPQISAINFPDLTRFDIRSWEACRMAGRSKLDLIAHLRAIDFDINQPFPLKDFFNTNHIGKVLVIEGDKPVNSHRKTYPTKSLDFISKLRDEAGELKIYAAFDPYRNNIRYELDYVVQKMNAGATGFFSQPFFDLRLLEIYSEYLEGLDIYWGICPVITDSSKAYWESRNRAIFPKSFLPTLDWNVRFGHQVIDFCCKRNFNLYLMPITIDLTEYLSELFR